MGMVSAVVEGLSGANGLIVLIALILVGIHFWIKNTFDKAGEISSFFIKSVSGQLQNISDEVKLTREALVTMQQSQIHFGDRLERVEEYVEKYRPAC